MSSSFCVLGANSLVGQHLLAQLRGQARRVSLWTAEEKFGDRLEQNQNEPGEHVAVFCGADQLRDALADCQVVLNVHELRDFSLAPDQRELEAQNVEFVRTLLELCTEAGVQTLVQLSSVYVQCSAWWPNVGGREARKPWCNPYGAYCDSKLHAEQLVLDFPGPLRALVVRAGELFGEGDRCSLLCDLLRCRQLLGRLPVVGQASGALQMTYAGNLAAGLLDCAAGMSGKGVRRELVNYVDSTPVRSLYEGPVRDCLQTEQNKFSSFQVPFALFFPLISLFLLLASWWPGPRRASLPSIAFNYMVLRQWTFFSNYRLRLLFQHTPKFSAQESLARSRAYYAQLDGSEVNSWSWKAYPS